jgi:NAD(P)-dependent dehydrogenase (short-subunit alcohol dehydrogenase family)
MSEQRVVMVTGALAGIGRATATAFAISLSSTVGERGAPGAALYSASKHAVNGFTRPPQQRR